MSVSLINTGITFFDADSRGGAAAVVVTSSRGILTFTAGTTGVTGTASSGTLGGNTTATLNLSGTIKQFDTFFRGTAGTPGTLVFASSIAGVVNFTIRVTDEDGLVSITNFVGDVETVAPPVVAIPGGTLQVNTGVDFHLDGIGFGVTNAFDTGGYATLKIATSNGGVLTASPSNSGATVTSGNGSVTLFLAGTITSLNTFLTSPGSSTLFLKCPSNGAETITLTVTNASGLSNTPIVQNATSGQQPIVTSPAMFINASATVNKNIHGAGFSYTDSDASGTQTLNMSAAGSGTRTITVVPGTSGVTITGGNGTNSVTCTGTLAQINNLLTASSTGTIVFVDNVADSVTFTVLITDNTSRTGSGSVAIIVTSGAPTWTGYALATPTPTSTSIPSFIVPIDLSKLPNAWWTAVSADGRDIRVILDTDPQDAAHTLPRDLVHFNKSAKTGIMFALIPNNTSAPAIRIWAGTAAATPPAAGDPTGQFATYPSFVKAWWPDGGGADRTSNAITLTPSSGGVGDTTADFGLATLYTSGKICKSAVGALPSPPDIFGCFVNPSSINSATIFSASRDSGSNLNILGFSLSKAFASSQDSFGGAGKALAIGNATTGIWQMVSGYWASNTLRTAYRAGVNAGTDSTFVNVGSGVANSFYSILGGGGSPSVGLTFILNGLSSSLVAPWFANYGGAFNQVSYWPGGWTWTATNITGL